MNYRCVMAMRTFSSCKILAILGFNHSLTTRYNNNNESQERVDTAYFIISTTESITMYSLQRALLYIWTA